MNFVQRGTELSYQILHDSDFRCVRLEHLVETDRGIRLKLGHVLDNLDEEHKFNFNVIAATHQEIVQLARKEFCTSSSSQSWMLLPRG
jgi:hypothetical protein